MAEKQFVWIASHESFDDGSKQLKACTSLLMLQTYVIKKAEKAVKSLGDEYEYVRIRTGNNIQFQIREKGDPLGPVEWFTIKRLELLELPS